MKTAYTDDGKVIPEKCETHQFKDKDEMLAFLNKSLFVPDLEGRDDLKNLKIYIQQLKAKYR